jgi:glycosyltransferase involved in cell wall biosynthesis
MRLSVIVPVYNMEAEGKLNYCLDSLAVQTMADMEVIAVDDASTDHSLDIMRSYEKKYPEKFHIVHCEMNRHQGGAKNEGLKYASGEWIGFIDSDDWIVPDYYERLIRKAEETGADVVGCDYSLVTEHTMQVGKLVRNNSAEQTGICGMSQRKSLAMRPGSMVLKIYRHEMITEHQLNFPENIFYEDNCAGSVWMLYCKRFEKIEEPLYYYYQHDTSTVHLLSWQRCLDRMQAGELLVAECAARGFLKTFHDEIEFRFTEIYYVTTLFSYLGSDTHPRLDRLAQLRDGIKRFFPDFQKNPYYTGQIGEEEQKLIRLHMKGNLQLLLYYKALHFYRMTRYGKKQK